MVMNFVVDGLRDEPTIEALSSKEFPLMERSPPWTWSGFT